MTLDQLFDEFDAREAARKGTPVVSPDERANAFRTRLQRSGIPSRYAGVTKAQIMHYAADPAKQPALDAVLKLVREKHIAGKSGILLSGSFGTGKTTLATYAFKTLLWENARADGVWTKSYALVRNVQAGYADGTARQVLQQASCATVLLLDDLGDLDKAQDTVDRRQIIYEVLDSRSDAILPTLVTTNLTSVDLAKQFGERPFQRLLELCHLVRMDGINYRMS